MRKKLSFLIPCAFFWYIFTYFMGFHFVMQGHPLSAYVKFSEKQKFLTPWYAHDVSFSENFAYVLSGWLILWHQELTLKNLIPIISFLCYMGCAPQLFRNRLKGVTNLSNMSTWVSRKIGKVEKTKLWTTTEIKKK